MGIHIGMFFDIGVGIGLGIHVGIIGICSVLTPVWAKYTEVICLVSQVKVPLEIRGKGMMAPHSCVAASVNAVIAQVAQATQAAQAAQSKNRPPVKKPKKGAKS